MNDRLLVIKDLSKSFNPKLPPALSNISLNVPKGQIVGVAGPDGAGKSTLIRLIAGLLKPTTGTVTVAGYDTIKDARDVHRLIGYMPQKFGLYEDLTVQQNLNLYADLKDVVGPEREESFKKLLSFTDLKDFTDRLTGNLSGGMKQKLGLACALLQKPTLLLLDEPSVGVDPISRRELWKMVHELLNEGISAIWSTAYLDEAERADTTILLNEGKLLYYGPPSGLAKRVEGRSFKITNIAGNRRQVLEQVLLQDNVIDGTIQGNDVRIVLKIPSPSAVDMEALENGSSLKLIPTPPRFEDGFIDILGGSLKGPSVLAQITPEVKDKRDDVIVAQGLSKRFGSFIAARNISFKIPSGEIFGLLGPNGAGKSTTFKMLCGLLRPDRGKAFVNGYDLEIAPSEGRAQIGYMAQKFSLYGNLSVLQNLIFFSGIYNISGMKQVDDIKKMIEIFSLKPYLDDNAEELPLGFKQRLALSCSVMHHPPVLFLDEPTSGVDPITRREFWKLINSIVEKGITVMVTTHFMDEAEYCDRIALVYKSRIITIGTPDTLKASAKTAENPDPTLEDAFVYLIEHYDEKNHAAE